MQNTDNVHKNHRKRLRERYEREGADSFEPHELLELFLFDAIPRVNTNPIAHRLLNRFNSLDGVLRASAKELMEVKGIGERAANYIVECAESERRDAEEALRKKPLASFERASNYLIWRIRDRSRTASPEHAIIAIFMDETLHVTETRDYEGENARNMTEDAVKLGAHNVIVGCGKSMSTESIPDADDFENCGVRLCDVIRINGYDAESLMN